MKESKTWAWALAIIFCWVALTPTLTLAAETEVVNLITDYPPININTADASELVKLKFIGPKRAAKIIAFRKKYGDFKTPADIKKIKGIGKKTFLRIEHNICVEY